GAFHPRLPSNLVQLPLPVLQLRFLSVGFAFGVFVDVVGEGIIGPQFFQSLLADFLENLAFLISFVVFLVFHHALAFGDQASGVSDIGAILFLHALFVVGIIAARRST